MIFPQVSVIVPCRNEQRHIKTLLDNLLAMDYPKEKLEIIVADGMSDDGTTEIIEEICRVNSHVRLVQNEEKIVSFALNRAIKIANGEFIIRMDAHAIYPNDYIFTLISVALTTGADNVGAMWETIPGADSLVAKAISIATSHSFGVGNATYRLPNDSNVPIEVDTVPFGCFPKRVFKAIGYFDEDLVRNQDNEFNERLLKSGGKILLIPDLKIKYFARENYPKLWKMFFQYAYFGPLVDKKLRRLPRLRRFIPGVFVLTVFLPLLPGIFYRFFRNVSFFSGGLYCLINLGVSMCLAGKNRDLKLAPLLFISFVVSHFSYGIGYIKGFLDFKMLNLQSRNVTISR